MKKVFLLFITLFLMPLGAHAAICYEGGCSHWDEWAYITNSWYFEMNVDDYTVTDSGCDTNLYSTCYGDSVKIYSCPSCKPGYTRTYHNMDLGGCSSLSFYTCTYNCVNSCTVGSSSSCYTISNGVGTRKVLGGNSCTTGCTYGACNVSYCYAGYYKKSETECASCASGTGVSNATSNSGNSIGLAACYIPTGSTFDDPTGDGDFMSNCYHD